MELVVIAICVAVLLLALSLFLLRNPNSLFILSWFITFFPIEYIDRYFIKIPSLLKWVPQLLIIFMCFLSFFLKNKKKLILPPIFTYSFLLYILINILSYFYNPSNIPEFIFSQRGIIFLFGYLSIFTIIYNKLSHHDLLLLTVKTGIISSILALIQRVYVTITSKTGDMITGLFSVDSQYLFFQCICFIIVLSFWFNGKQIITKYSNQSIALLFVVSVGLANNKAGIAFFVLICLIFSLFVGYQKFWKFFKKLIYIGIVISFALLAFDAIVTSRYKSISEKEGSFVYYTNKDYIEQYFFGKQTKDGFDSFDKSGSLKRGAAIVFGFNLIKTDAISIFLGKGPGSTSPSSLGAAEGYISKKYPGYKIGKSLLSERLTETGLLGLFSFYFLLSVIYFSTRYTLFGKNETSISMAKKVAFVFLICFSPYENLSSLLIYNFVLSLFLYPSISLEIRKDVIKFNNPKSIAYI
jgi:hypothetical protein